MKLFQVISSHRAQSNPFKAAILHFCLFHAKGLFFVLGWWLLPFMAMATTVQPPGSVAPLAKSLPGFSQAKISGPLTVQQAVAIGLQYNPEIEAARSDVQAAAQETQSVQSMTRPQLSANSYLSTGSMVSILNSSPGSIPTSTLSVPGQSSVDQNLTLMLPIYTGGRLGGLVHAAMNEEQAAGAGVRSEQTTIALAIREAYYQALLSDQMALVAQAQVDADTELVRNSQNLFEAGKGIKAQVARGQAELANAHQNLTLAQNDRAKAMLDLQTAMGVQPDSPITLADTLSYIEPTGNLETSLTEAFLNRPNLMSARSQLKAAQSQLEAERGSLQPQVYGQAMADAFSPGQMGRNAGITLGVTVSVPLLDGGQRRADIARAQARVAHARADLQEAELTASNEVRKAWLDIQTAQQNVDTAKTALVAAQQSYEVTRLRVENQKAIQVELLDAIAALTQARTNVAQSLYDHSIAIARLLSATGKV